MKENYDGLFKTNGETIPLTSVKVVGNILGNSSLLTISKKFLNSEDVPIEAIYKFPLPEDSTLANFKIIIDDKVIDGEIEEREKAFEIYDEAMENNDGGFLLDEERPNIFTISLGNIKPGSEVIVELLLITTLKTRGNELTFFMPTTISPRYIPNNMEDENGIAVNDIVNPTYADSVTYGMEIELKIYGKDNINSISSPTHKIKSEFYDDFIKVTHITQEIKMNKDFIINIERNIKNLNSAFWNVVNGETFIQFNISPKFEIEDRNERKNIIFLLDCSVSMCGSSIEEAKKALEIFLKGLNKNTFFNIYLFGSEYEKFYDDFVEYNEKNLDKTLEKLKNVDAVLGGTEISEPLRDIYAFSIDGRVKEDIILITDGEVGNEEEILKIVKNDKNRRIFTVGIGSGINEFFINSMARVTGGTSEIVSYGERIERKILRLFSNISSPIIENARINWNCKVEESPKSIFLFNENSTTIYAKLKKGEKISDSNIILTVDIDGKEKTLEVTPSKLTDNSKFLDKLWAREIIRELEEGRESTGSNQIKRKEAIIKNKIIKISKKYGLPSKHTSFVAVEKRKNVEKSNKKIEIRRVPSLITEGYGRISPFIRKSFQHKKMFFKTFSPMENLSSIDGFCRMAPGVPDPAVEEKRKKIERMTKRLKNMNVPQSSAHFDLCIEDSSSDKEELLYDILSTQKLEGGFELNKNLILRMGLSYKDIVKSANSLKEKDSFLIISTAVTIPYLKLNYGEFINIWFSLVEKSVEWFKQYEQLEIKIDKKTVAKYLIENIKKNKN